MDNVTSVGKAHATVAHAPHHEEELSFLRKYVFSVDHKWIGIQYGITSLLFLLFGFSLMILMRWQLAFPGRPIPLIGPYLGQANAPGGIMLPSSTTSSARCTGRSWSSWVSCRWP